MKAAWCGRGGWRNMWKMCAHIKWNKKWIENVYEWGAEEALELFTVINNRESFICRWMRVLLKMKKNRKLFTRCSVGKQINGFTQAFRLILHDLKFKSSASSSMISWKRSRCWSVYRLSNQSGMDTWRFIEYSCDEIMIWSASRDKYRIKLMEIYEDLI